MRSKLTIALCAALAALCLAGPLAAQLPRQRRLDTFSQIRHHLRTGGFARTVTVSPAGGDYAELDTACSFVATQARSATATWLVLVYPGNYTTDCTGAPVAAPTFTSIFRYADLSPMLLDSADTPADEECGTWEVTSGTPQIEWQPCGGTGSPYNRVVIVDPAGGGDYLTVEEAVAFVATQTRGDAARWVIELEPGPDYSVVAPFAVPSHTTIRGMIPHSIIPFQGQVRIVSPAVASGTFITLNAGSVLANVTVRFNGTLTGAAKVVEVVGSGAAMLNCTIENNASAATQPLVLVETTSGVTTSFTSYYNYWASIASATNLTYFKHQNAGTTYITDTIMRSSTGAAAIIHNTSTGTISLIRSALGPFYSTNSDPNTFSLLNDSTGKIEPMQTSFWGPTSGTIDDWHQVARTRTFVDTPFATCTPIPAEIAIDIGTTKRICVCVAANDWDCATLTP